MALVLLIGYFIIWLYQIITLISCVRNKKKWKDVFYVEFVSIIFAALATYAFGFDLIPYKGMSGIGYLGEFVFSFLSLGVYLVTLLITILVKVIIDIKNKKKIENQETNEQK